MNKTVEEINKMIMEDAPMEEINDAIAIFFFSFFPFFFVALFFLKNAASIGKQRSLLSAKPLSVRSGTHGM